MHPAIRELQQSQLQKRPEIRTGYTVRVHQKIKEGGKERIQQFEGLVIKVGHGEGVENTFTVRKIVEGIGVEKIFPLHSPNIDKIVVKKMAKVRREKLYYMRDRFGKSARLSERHVSDEERATEEAKMEALYAEAVKAEEKRKKEEASAEVTPEEVQQEEVQASAEEATATEAPVEEKAETPAGTAPEAPAEEAAAEEKTEEAAATEAPAEEKTEAPAAEETEKKED